MSASDKTITGLLILSITVIVITFAIDIFTDQTFVNDSFLIHIRDIVLFSGILSVPFSSAILFVTFPENWLRYTAFVLNSLFSMVGGFFAFNYISHPPPIYSDIGAGLALIFPFSLTIAVLVLRAK